MWLVARPAGPAPPAYHRPSHCATAKRHFRIILKRHLIENDYHSQPAENPIPTTTTTPA